MATDCIMFALAIISNALADRFLPPCLRGESLEKHLLNTYSMAGTRLDDESARQLKHTFTLKNLRSDNE